MVAVLICALSILYFRLKSYRKCSETFWDLIHLYGILGSLGLPLYTWEWDCLMGSEANQCEQSYQCVCTQQICQRLQYHSIEQKSLSVKILRKTISDRDELLAFWDWEPAHSFWQTDPPPLFKSKKHHKHFNLMELFVTLYQNISWYFSVIQHVCSCWFWIFFNPRKMIPILTVSY